MYKDGFNDPLSGLIMGETAEELAVEAGVTALVQPGGSIRDSEVIGAVDRGHAAMLLTGVRHFRH